MLRVLLAGVPRAYGKAGSFSQTRTTNRRSLCVNQVLYGSPLHYFQRGNVFSPTVAPMSRYVLCGFFHFPTQPPNENNNFDHNKAAKIISRGSWLNIVSIDKIKIFIIAERFALFLLLMLTRSFSTPTDNIGDHKAGKSTHTDRGVRERIEGWLL